MVVLPHCDPFSVTSVGCCWVSVNIPCWEKFTDIPLMVTGTQVGISPTTKRVALGSGWRGGSFTPGKFPVAPERAFVPGHSTMWLHFCSPVPAALLSRLSAGHLCCLDAILLHAVLLLKGSALPAVLGKLVLPSRQSIGAQLQHAAGSASLQKFRSVFCCFHRSWDITFQGLQFPGSFWLLEFPLQFGAVSELQS
jgi:hypothetical protein